MHKITVSMINRIINGIPKPNPIPKPINSTMISCYLNSNEKKNENIFMLFLLEKIYTNC